MSTTNLSVILLSASMVVASYLESNSPLNLDYFRFQAKNLTESRCWVQSRHDDLLNILLSIRRILIDFSSILVKLVGCYALGFLYGGIRWWTISVAFLSCSWVIASGAIPNTEISALNDIYIATNENLADEITGLAWNFEDDSNVCNWQGILLQYFI